MEEQDSRYRRWCHHLGDDEAEHGLSDVEKVKRLTELYYSLKRELTIAPDGSYPTEMQDGDSSLDASPSTSKRRTAPPLEVNNPLSLSDNNPWHTYFASLSMLDQIKLDVERAFPEDEELRSSVAQAQLTRILFVWSLIDENKNVGYRQGMHELAAICWLVRKEERMMTGTEGQLEVDTFHLFSLIMHRARPWYEWRNHTHLPISSRCQAISSLLNVTDSHLANHLASIGVEIQLFAIRWIRLLFTREMPLIMALKLWDSLFQKDPTLELIDAICVAMLIRIRTQLLNSDYSAALQALLNYPTYALQVSPSTLVVQAKLIRDSTTRETLMTLIQANEEMLKIPVITSEEYEYASLPGSYGSSVASLPPSLSHLTKGLSAQTLSAGFGRALYNVQRSVNAAYTAHAGANGNANGFPPSFETLSRSYSVGAGRENIAELDRLKETNRMIGDSMDRVIQVLEKHWIDSVAESDKDANKEVKTQQKEEDFLLCLTTLKHSRDVLYGNAADFDATIMDGPKIHQPKKDTKARDFGDRFKRTVEVEPMPASVPQSSVSTSSPDAQPIKPSVALTTVSYPVRKPKAPTAAKNQTIPLSKEDSNKRPSNLIMDDPLGAINH